MRPELGSSSACRPDDGRTVAPVYAWVRRLVCLLLCSLLAVSLVAACGDDDDDERATDPAAQTAPQVETDRELATELFTILKKKDMKELDDFLSPAFQLQRTDGTYIKKADYLKNPAHVDSFELFEMSGTRYGNTRVLRFVARVSALLNGKPTGNDPAPRLATYVWNGKRWQLISYANYVAIHPAGVTTTTTASR
jgi:hypothetical protein